MSDHLIGGQQFPDIIIDNILRAFQEYFSVVTVKSATVPKVPLKNGS
jgi:hypothetical protein